MKPFSAGDVLALTDAVGTALGTIDVERTDPARVLGTFRPAAGFKAVAPLFREFEEHVDAAALAVLPAIERRIAELRLHIGRAGEPPAPTADVQIYTDGGFSCRLVVPADVNGAVAPHSATVS